MSNAFTCRTLVIRYELWLRMNRQGNDGNKIQLRKYKKGKNRKQ